VGRPLEFFLRKITSTKSCLSRQDRRLDGYPEFTTRMAQEQVTSDDISAARGQMY
jgi:hypothetical protein